VFKFVRKLSPEISKKHFKFTLAPEEVRAVRAIAPTRGEAAQPSHAPCCAVYVRTQISDRLTGFGKGAVCPVGMTTPIPVILSDRLTRLSPQFMWLGGGHVRASLPWLSHQH
jgi:hypothetical protein